MKDFVALILNRLAEIKKCSFLYSYMWNFSSIYFYTVDRFYSKETHQNFYSRNLLISFESKKIYIISSISQRIHTYILDKLWRNMVTDVIDGDWCYLRIWIHFATKCLQIVTYNSFDQTKYFTLENHTLLAYIPFICLFLMKFLFAFSCHWQMLPEVFSNK